MLEKTKTTNKRRALVLERVKIPKKMMVSSNNIEKL
jgi:hypothetical protein